MKKKAADIVAIAVVLDVSLGFGILMADYAAIRFSPASNAVWPIKLVRNLARSTESITLWAVSATEQEPMEAESKIGPARSNSGGSVDTSNEATHSQGLDGKRI